MNTRMKTLVLVLALVIGLGSGAAPRAQAQPGGPPQFKMPTPARFTLTGLIMDGDTVFKVSGGGAQSGDRWQLEMVATPAQGNPTTARAIQIGQMYYYQFNNG